LIVDLLDVFNLGTTDHEDLYYELQGIASVIYSMRDIESPTDLLRAYEGIASLGYSNAEIASIVMNGVMTFLYPQLPAMYDTSGLEIELADRQAELDAAWNSLYALDDEVYAEILLISNSDPNSIDMASELWNAYNLREESYALFDNTLNNYSWDNEMFQWWLWEDLSAAIDREDYAYTDYVLMNMDWEEYDMYYQLIMSYQDYINYDNELEEVFEFVMMNENYPLSSYLSDKAMALMSYYMNINWCQSEVNRLENKIAGIEDRAWLPQTLEIMLGDIANITLTEQVIVILLDQVDAWEQNPDIDFIDAIPMIIENGLAGLNATEISAELMKAGSFIQVLFGTIDATDEAILEDFIIEFTNSYATTQTDNLLEETAMQIYLSGVVTMYLTQILDIPEEVGFFLQSMDVTKTQALLDEIGEIMWLIPIDPNYDTRMTIQISRIIDLIVGDSSLDYSAIYSPILGVIYSVNGYVENPLPSNYLVVTGYLDTQIAAIIAQAALIGGLDPLTVSEAQGDLIEDLMSYVFDLGEYIDSILNPEIPVV